MKKTTQNAKKATQKKASKSVKKTGLQSSELFTRKDGRIVLVNAKKALALYKERLEKKTSFNGLEEAYGLQRQNGMVSYRVFNAVKTFLKQNKGKKTA